MGVHQHIEGGNGQPRFDSMSIEHEQTSKARDNVLMDTSGGGDTRLGLAVTSCVYKNC